MSNSSNASISLGYLSQLLIVAGMAMVGAFVFSFVGLYIAFYLYGVDLVSIAEVLSIDNPSIEQVQSFKIMQLFASIGTFIVPALVAPFIVKEHHSDYLSLRKPKLNPLILAGLLVVIILPFNSFLIEISEKFAAFIGSTSLEELQKEQENMMKVILQMNGFNEYLFNLLVVALVPAIGEELLFRGFAQSLFKRWTGNMHAAVIIQGVVFGAIHQQVHNFIPLAALGILLGYIVWYTGSIWVGILMHFINNALAVTAYYFMKDDSVWEQMVNDNFPIYLSIISLILSAGIFYVIWKNRTIEEEITIEIE